MRVFRKFRTVFKMKLRFQRLLIVHRYVHVGFVQNHVALVYVHDVLCRFVAGKSFAVVGIRIRIFIVFNAVSAIHTLFNHIVQKFAVFCVIFGVFVCFNRNFKDTTGVVFFRNRRYVLIGVAAFRTALNIRYADEIHVIVVEFNVRQNGVRAPECLSVFCSKMEFFGRHFHIDEIATVGRSQPLVNRALIFRRILRVRVIIHIRNNRDVQFARRVRRRQLVIERRAEFRLETNTRIILRTDTRAVVHFEHICYDIRGRSRRYFRFLRCKTKGRR